MTIIGLMRSPSGIVIIETVLLALLMFGTFSVLVRVCDMHTIGLWVLVNSLLGFARVADFWSKGLSSFIGEARGQGDDDENWFHGLNLSAAGERLVTRGRRQLASNVLARRLT